MERRIGFWLLCVVVFLGMSLLPVITFAASRDIVYEAVSPLGRSTVQITPPSPRLSSMEGKKIGFVWNLFTNGDVLSDTLADLLGRRLKDLECIKLASGKGLKWGSYPESSIKDVIKEAEIDALISTVGG